MHHQVAVGVGDRVAHRAEKLEPGRHAEPRVVAVVADRPAAVDVLHDDVGHAQRGGAAAVEPGDAGMLEAGLHLALGAEAFVAFRAAGPQGLDRHQLVELVVRPGGQEDRAHAALAELAEQGIGPELAGRRQRREGRAERPDGGIEAAGAGEVLGQVVRPQRLSTSPRRASSPVQRTSRQAWR